MILTPIPACYDNVVQFINEVFGRCLGESSAMWLKRGLQEAQVSVKKTILLARLDPRENLKIVALLKMKKLVIVLKN